jgi:hypothetical protein
MRLLSMVITAAAVAIVAAMASPASAQEKTVKACQDEWRANKADFKARGITEKAYVAQCRGETTAQPTPAPAPTQTAAPPPAAPAPSAAPQKSASACRREWRANRDAFKAAGVTQKLYVERCQAGETVAVPAAPPPAAPTAAPTAAPPPAPAPAPTATVTVAATSTRAGQFATEAEAKSACIADTVVWANLKSMVYHFAGYKNYGNTKRGAYMCEKQAVTQGFRASKTEKHPGA